MEIIVSAPTGNVVVSAGSCMWSGMHIRLSSQETLRYTVPASAQKVSVYLHYTKNVDTQVEAVEFVLSVGSERSTTNHLEDGTVEAYTLFCSFTANSSTFSNMTLHFTPSMSHEELEKLVDYAHEEVVLFEGEAHENEIINLNESFRSFYEIEFVARGTDDVTPNGNSRRVLVSQIKNNGEFIEVPIIGADLSPEYPKYGVIVRFMPWLLQIRSDTSLYAQHTRCMFLGEGMAMEEHDKGYITKIIGVGRKK
jgi:hypothetical protein